MMSPLPGRIAELKYKNGDPIQRGSAVLILESMKMNITLCAETSGRIRYLVDESEIVLRKEELFIIED